MTEARPGQSQASAMRSVQYDTVSDRYWPVTFIEEIFPKVEETYQLREPPLTPEAPAGLSSGGICAFKDGVVSIPQHFSRVHSDDR